MGMAAWASAEVDREDENSYERTSTLDGHKAFEKCQKKTNRCELSVIAKNRYVVTAECDDCGMDRLKKAIKSMDLDELPATKTESWVFFNSIGLARTDKPAYSFSFS